jgi:hypothetical protein
MNPLALATAKHSFLHPTKRANHIHDRTDAVLITSRRPAKRDMHDLRVDVCLMVRGCYDAAALAIAEPHGWHKPHDDAFLTLLTALADNGQQGAVI